MWKYIRKPFGRLVPEHVGNPFSLIARMLTSGKRSAVFTLWLAGVGIVLTPIDMILSIRERKLIANNQAGSESPVIFVCGPARSGTTVTYQLLSHYLPTQYIPNLSMLFPRSPITASRHFGRFFRQSKTLDLDNYYGKTPGMLGPSEANHIWNRWVEPDPTGFRTVLSETNASEMAKFFRAMTRIEKRPLINKNNNMNVFADIVHRHLPNSYFICLRRHPAFLAQSLLAAREEIRGSISKGYGVEDASKTINAESNPIIAVCRQVHYLDNESRRMQSLIGADRFRIVDYEQFCQNPGQLVRTISSEILHCDTDETFLASIPMLKTTNAINDIDQMNSIVVALQDLGMSFSDLVNATPER